MTLTFLNLSYATKKINPSKGTQTFLLAIVGEVREFLTICTSERKLNTVSIPGEVLSVN